MKTNWEAVKVISTIVIAIVGGIWAFVVWYWPTPPIIPVPPARPPVTEPESRKPQIATLKVCRGEDPKQCATNDRFIGCNDVGEWAKNACKASFKQVMVEGVRGGNKCGYAIAIVECGN